MTRTIEQAPGYQDILDARQRIFSQVANTPVRHSDALNEALGCTLHCKCENLQETGAFKFRGASNAIIHLREMGISTDVATHSSGNHGAALAHAARLDGRKAFVVMPENAVRTKVEAVRRYGGEVIFCEPTHEAREAGLAELVAQGCIPIPPYDHVDIIAGQGTAALEFLEVVPGVDILMTPVGGGGLISGTAIAARQVSPGVCLIAAEPEGAADTAASFGQRKRVSSWRPETVADGLRALVGQMTFPIILDLVDQVLTVSEDGILMGMDLVYEHLDMVIEPSSSVVIAAIREHPEVFTGKTVGVILSGGNIDPAQFPQLAGNAND